MLEGSIMDGIEIQGFSKHGVSICAANVTASNNYIHHNGGCRINTTNTERMGNGLEVWGDGSKNVIVKDNDFDNNFDANLTVQSNSSCTKGAENILFEGNTSSNCTYPLEIFNSLKSNKFKNIVVRNNKFINSTVTGRRKDNRAQSLLCLWDQRYPEDTIIENNLFYKTSKQIIHTKDRLQDIHAKIINNRFIGDTKLVDSSCLTEIKENNTVIDSKSITVKQMFELINELADARIYEVNKIKRD